MKIIILVMIISVLAETSLAESYPEYGQKQEMPSVPPMSPGIEKGQKQEMPDGPPGIKVETSAREQENPQQYKMETIANEQGEQQFEDETSAKQQGPPGIASAMQGKPRMPESPAEEEEQAVQEEDNDVMEDLANVNQVVLAPLARWPFGRYALPRPASGCPPGWTSGWRYSDNEDNRNINSESVGIVTRMNVVVGTNTRKHYCVKNFAGSLSSGSWPRGRYCIARKGGSCPTGFSTGSVYWDDEDFRNGNRIFGILPDGNYGFDTRIYFCCRSDGSTSISARLPTSSPFILYRFGASCQRVAGMSIYQDFIFTDDEDFLNINHCTGSHPAGSCGRDIRLNYCYYYKYY